MPKANISYFKKKCVIYWNILFEKQSENLFPL